MAAQDAAGMDGFVDMMTEECTFGWEGFEECGIDLFTPKKGNQVCVDNMKALFFENKMAPKDMIPMQNLQAVGPYVIFKNITKGYSKGDKSWDQEGQVETHVLRMSDDGKKCAEWKCIFPKENIQPFCDFWKAE